ncbi:MAG: PRC-barrel domain-containing protein [Alphaproteobacteria bacterium]|nr:PRC-barrel domain-containing protein [Alphaproteobacteria bacterium]
MTFKTSLVAAVAALLLAAPALAQAPVADTAPLPANTFIDAQPEANYLAKDVLIGAKVEGSDGKIIGDIEDVILNDWNRVQGVVMGTGGFLGIAEKRVGVNLGSLEFQDRDGKRVVVLPGVTQETLKAVPEFKRAEPKKSLLERAMDKARELTDKSSETAKEAYQKAKEQSGPALEQAKEAAGKAYESTKEAAGKAYETTKDAAGKAYEKAKEAAEGALNKDAPPAPADGQPPK